MIEIYRIFTLPPDFQQAPEASYDTGRRDIQLGDARRYGLWDMRAKRIVQAIWRVASTVDTRTLREFLEENQGRANPFYIPSWTPDFRVQEPATTGDSEVKIKVGVNLQAELSPEKLDEFGTVAWFYSRNRQMHLTRILSAATNLDGTTDIELEVPLGFDIDSETTSGFCLFARQAQDVVEARVYAPDAMEVRIAIEEARHTLETTETLPLAGADIFSYPAITEVSRNPLSTLTSLRPDKANAQGPEVYGGSQIFPHQKEWEIEITTTGVRMKPAGGSWAASTHYSVRPEGDHIAGAFNVGGTEVLAAGLFTGEVEIRYFDGLGDSQAEKFEGFSPQVVNTWAVDDEVTAGNADVAVVYLKKGEAKLYARFSRESYATEHKLIDSPINPLYLLDIEAEDARLKVHGLDATHNKTTWESIVTPVPNVIFEQAAATGILGGEYVSTIIQPDYPADAMTVEAGFQGEYVAVVQTPPDLEEGADITGNLDAEYLEVVREPSTLTEGMTLTGEIQADYSLVIKPTPAHGESATATGAISGSYEPDP